MLIWYRVMNIKEFEEIKKITYSDIRNEKNTDILKAIKAIKIYKLRGTVGLVKMATEDKLKMFTAVHFFATDEVCFDILKIEEGHLAVDYSVRAEEVEKIITQRDMNKIGLLDFRTKNFKKLVS